MSAASKPAPAGAAGCTFTGPNRAAFDARDQDHWKRLSDIVAGAGLGLEDVLKHFPAYVRRRDMPRFLAHYELFKLIVDLPGSIAELGVYRGNGLFTWAKLMETFCPGDRTRKVFGFDHFEGYATWDQRDGDLAPWLDNVVGHLVSDAETMRALVALSNDDNLLAGDERCRIIEGDVCQSLPRFVAENEGLGLSVLYFDIGLYEPTMAGLRHLYPLVVPGGVVAFNGYGMRPWEGETTAVDGYFESIGERPVLRKFPFSTLPHGYFVKA